MSTTDDPPYPIDKAAKAVSDLYGDLLFGTEEYELVGGDGINVEIDELLCIAIRHLQMAFHTLNIANFKEKELKSGSAYEVT